jgi:hypothetical protein
VVPAKPKVAAKAPQKKIIPLPDFVLADLKDNGPQLPQKVIVDEFGNTLTPQQVRQRQQLRAQRPAPTQTPPPVQDEPPVQEDSAPTTVQEDYVFQNNQQAQRIAARNEPQIRALLNHGDLHGAAALIKETIHQLSASDLTYTPRCVKLYRQLAQTLAKAGDRAGSAQSNEAANALAGRIREIIGR